MRADDWGSFYLDDQVVASDCAVYQLAKPFSREVELQVRRYRLRLEYAEKTGVAAYTVSWRKLGTDGFDWRPVDPSCLSM